MLLESNLSELSWLTIDKISFLRRTLTEAGITYEVPTNTQQMIRQKPMDITIPGDIVGTGNIASFTEISVELKKFFKSLPETSQGIYRGYRIEEFLEMSFKEFFTWFQNHPKFRSLALAVKACGIEDLTLTERLEHLSYQEAYAVLVARELRKMREESRVFLPGLIWSETSECLSLILRKNVLDLLSFYRCHITVVEQ